MPLIPSSMVMLLHQVLFLLLLKLCFLIEKERFKEERHSSTKVAYDGPFSCLARADPFLRYGRLRMIVSARLLRHVNEARASTIEPSLSGLKYMASNYSCRVPDSEHLK